MKVFVSLLTSLIIFSFKIFSQDLQTCDLLFVKSGQSDFSHAIKDSTTDKDSLDYVHVGVLIIENGESRVIEASPERGVVEVSLKDFLREAPKINGKPGVVVKRLNINFPHEQTVENLKQCLGQPYDWYYLPDNEKKYCSELVYDSFLYSDGSYIFSAEPMNFKNSDGKFPDFWVKLFDRIGMEVPQGIMGTNPNVMSKDINLMEIHRFY